jgi:hypothetical protein
LFAFLAIFFGDLTSDPAKIAIIAVGFQQAMDVTRLFDLCLRWSVNVETQMFSVQRLMQIVNLEPEQIPRELKA